MFHEYETKVLDIDVAEIEEKLHKLGAVLIEKETVMRRRIFDVQLYDKNERGKWIRLRQQGKKTTLTYKEKGGPEIGETQELETNVEDFDAMREILQKLEWKSMAYLENKRKTYSYDDIEFCIDTRPRIPSYLEIEAPSEEKVYKGLEMLGLTGKEVGNIGVVTTYRKYGIDLGEYKELKFE